MVRYVRTSADIVNNGNVKPEMIVTSDTVSLYLNGILHLSIDENGWVSVWKQGVKTNVDQLEVSNV